MPDLPQDIEVSSTAWQVVDPKSVATTSPTWTPYSLWSRYRDDIFWIGIYLAANAFVFWLRFRQYPIDPCVAFAPAVAKGSAEVVMFNCTLTLLSVCHRVIDRLRLWVTCPVSATSPLRQRPLEMHREFHVLTGTIVLTMSLVHSLAWALIIHWCRTCNERDWSRSALSTHTAKRLREVPSLVRLALTLPMWTGLVMVICVLLLLPFSIGRVRRAYFPTFASVHRAVLIPFIVILSIHGAAQWTSHLQAPLWLVPALAIYAAERYGRLSQSTTSAILCFDTTSAVSETPAATTIRLFLTKTKRFHRCFEPGMFVYLQVPAVSSLEWHPFSVCSSQDDPLIELRIRVVGDWTRQLLLHLQETVKVSSERELVPHTLVPVSIPARIDGPFGTPTIHFHRYDSIALVALGGGIFPLLSVLRHQLHTWRRQLRLLPDPSGSIAPPFPNLTPPLKVAWVVRDLVLVEWFAETLSEFDDVVARVGREVLDLQLFVTTTRASDSPLLLPGGHVHVHWRRPDWPQLINGWTTAPAAPRAIFISGSHAAARAIKHAAVKLPPPQTVDVYAEHFY